MVGDALVGHDGGGVGIDQHGFDAFLAEGFAGLGAGVVKFGGLTDDDGAGAYDQYFLRLVCDFGASLYYAPTLTLPRRGRGFMGGGMGVMSPAAGAAGSGEFFISRYYAPTLTLPRRGRELIGGG